MSGAACLQLDLGNSRIKWRLVDGAEVLARGSGSRQPDAGHAWLALETSPLQVHVASVAGAAAEAALAAQIESRWGIRPWFARSTGSCSELVNSYREPERMGVDRWLAMIGARERSPGRLCVVDSGSALTIDLVSEDGHHEGGYIIPGGALMERALLLDTERVRFESTSTPGLTPGQSTADCVHHGIALAHCGALRLALAHAAATGAAPTVFVSGGGGPALLELADLPDAQYCEDLVMEGLPVLHRSL